MAATEITRNEQVRGMLMRRAEALLALQAT